MTPYQADGLGGAAARGRAITAASTATFQPAGQRVVSPKNILAAVSSGPEVIISTTSGAARKFLQHNHRKGVWRQVLSQL